MHARTRCPFRKSYASTFWRSEGVELGALSCHVWTSLPGDKEWTMPVPLAPPVTFADDEQCRVESIVRAHSTPQALSLRCQVILRTAAADRPSPLQVSK